MLTTLLLITQAAAEWVEISQHHYKKPTHQPHRHVETSSASLLPSTHYKLQPVSYDNLKESTVLPFLSHQPTHDQSTKSNRVYLNSSLQHTWGKGAVQRVRIKSNVERVHLNKSSAKTPIKPNPSDKTGIHFSPPRTFEGDKPQFITKNEKYDDDYIETSLENHPSSSSTEKTRHKTSLYYGTYYPVITSEKNSHKKQVTTDNLQIQYDEKNINTASTPKMNNNLRRIYILSSTETIPLDTPKKQEQEPLENIPYKYTTVKTEIFTREPFSPPTTAYEPLKPLLVLKPEFVTKKEIVSETESDHDDGVEVTDGDEGPYNDPQANQPGPTEKFADLKLSSMTIPSIAELEKLRNLRKSKKSNPLKSVASVIAIVGSTITQYSKSSMTNKIKYITSLKGALNDYLEKTLDTMWPLTQQSRSRRSTGRGHVDVPSAESALMTISFLTFAVFLIKLVLQVVHIYKNKAMMLAPTMVAAVGRSVASHSEKTRRP